MRLLFVSYPLYGHVNPMLPLALAARAAGHEVVFATGPDLGPELAAHGLAHWDAGPTHADVLAGHAPSPAMFTTGIAARADDLLRQARARAWRPDVVVGDEFELAGSVVAAVLGARHVVHGLGLMPPAAIWRQLEPALTALGDRHGIPDATERARAATYLELAPPALRPPGERVWDRAAPLRPVAVRPPDTPSGAPTEIDRLPRERTVHLTLGTLFHTRTEVLAAAIAGLRELPVNLVVASGPGSDPESFGPQPDHVLIRPYLPHARLLDRCALVVSQGGAGTFFAALARGIPQLLLPLGADQFINADAGRRAGAVLTLTGTNATPDAIGACARRLLAEPAFGAAADTLAREIAAMPGPDDAVATVLAELTAGARQ